MLLKNTIAKAADAEPALDQRLLYTQGLDRVRRLAHRLWTDHNVHDPGITILELLCYALTDLGYRASFPIADLLAGADPATQPLFTAGEILPNRPLTRLDYRKLVIDLKKVKNAWIEEVEQSYWADPLEEKLRWDRSRPDQREVSLRGLYRVIVELMDEVPAEEEETVLGDVMATLHAHRNLCEDFVSAAAVEPEWFLLCAELELAPDADVSRVQADVLFQVGQYLAPPVSAWTLSEMLERRKTVQEIFDGPLLLHGFIDDDELARAELRKEIRLSDVINIVMDVEGVRAVRDLIVNPQERPERVETRWLVPVTAGRQPRLNRTRSRLVCYKRGMPVPAVRDKVDARHDELEAEVRRKLETPGPMDLPVPRGRDRQPGRYHSFQNHFPEIYGLSRSGLPSGAGPKRHAQALQLKAYLLFFDQILADACARLAGVKGFLALDGEPEPAWFHQAVDSFAEFENVYEAGAAFAALRADEEEAWIEQRNRFLDHLVARFGERFHDYAAIMLSSFGAEARSLIAVKCAFLRSCAGLGAGRGLGHDRAGGVWDTDNVSGLEKRVAGLLGIADARRRSLSHADEEGMHLIENILLRPDPEDDVFLPICTDPGCTDCLEDDPYSYRVHIVLPAWAGRFSDMDFRRFAEEVIREEAPAHVLPRICWVDRQDMERLETAWRAWLEAKAGGADGAETLAPLVRVLYEVKNVYPPQRLTDCDCGEDQPKFILGRSALGSAEGPDRERPR